MTRFSNGTDAEIYKTNYCRRCQHFNPSDESLGCPILNMHFDHAGDPAWQAHLDEMIPPAPGPDWHGECAFFAEVNMIPDRLYQPPMPYHVGVMREAANELRWLAEECTEWATQSLEADGHGYVVDDPDHVCDETCPGGYASTGMWLHQMWARDAADRVDDYIAKYLATVEAPADLRRTR